MALTVVQQEALSRSTPFIARMKVLLCEKAKAVSTASSGVSPESKQLAGRVQSDPNGMAAKIAITFVSDNAIKSNNLNGGGDDTDRSDGQLASAINTAWDAGTWNLVV